MLYYAIFSIVCGLLVVAPDLVEKHKNFFSRLSGFQNRFVDYQGRFGVIVFVWGVFQLIQALIGISLLGMGAIGAVLWIVLLLISLVLIALGLFLGSELMTQYIPSQKKNVDKVLKKLTPYKKIIGFSAIGLGILQAIFAIILTTAVMVVV